MRRPTFSGIRNRIHESTLAERLGPGLITGAADDDPSGIATYSQAGAAFGYGLAWSMLLTYPLMCAIQLVSARVGRVTGKGLAANLGARLPVWLMTILLVGLFGANTINIGADFAAMGAAARLAIGANERIMAVIFAVVSLLLQLFIPYQRYANVLKWLTLTLLAYVALVFVVKVDWPAFAKGLFLPTLDGKRAISTVVAVFGTTISPYLFFWQSSQEVEETEQDDEVEPLLDRPEQSQEVLRGIRIDTFIGMAASNIVGLAIIVATAATLHANGKTSISTASDAASALRPVAGDFAFVLFSLGIVGTGLLAVPVLAGSAAYAIGEARGWKTGLDEKPWQAVGFYGAIGAATLFGFAMSFTSIDPMKQLFFSAIINGVIAAPIMAAMMWIATSRDTMGEFVAPTALRIFGLAATLIMAVASIALLAT